MKMMVNYLARWNSTDQNYTTQLKPSTVGRLEYAELELYLTLPIEVPLVCHDNYPSLILRAKIDAIENIQEIFAAMFSRFVRSDQEIIRRMFSEALAAHDDFDSHGNLQSLDQAILKYEAIIERIPPNGPMAAATLSNLGLSLIRRFEQLGGMADMNKGIGQLEMAVRVTLDIDPDKPSRLNDLGTALKTRFSRLENVDDINRAIAQHRAAVHLTRDDHPEKPSRLSSLGNSLLARFERLGNMDDLDSAIAQQQAAVLLTPDSHPDKPMCLNNLGISLESRFERLGNIDDVDGAITQQQAAVNLTPDGDPDKPIYLSNLGTSLRARFERLGNIDDIYGAIAQQQLVVHLTPDGHPNKPMYLTNLGIFLRSRFERLSNKDDIDGAITQQQAAIHLTPDGHPNMSMYLNNLGFSLLGRFERLGNIEDIDGAISQLQGAVRLTPDRHPEKPSRLTNLGNSFLGRFRRLGNVSDITQAIIQHQAAVDLTPDGHSKKPAYLANLGSSYGRRFFRFRHPQDVEAAISHLSTSAKSSVGTPTARFKAVERWISIAYLSGHPSSLSACECAFALIPLVAWLGLPIKGRHEHLIKIGEMARHAAAIAISFGQYDTALEWLEQGRSIVWNQILQLRTPVDELRIVNSGLADRLVRVSRLLDRGVEQEGSLGSAEQNAQRYRALTREWELILEEVRSLPSFENFLKPPKVSRLMGAAQNGLVVVLNMTDVRCDALALVSEIEEVIHIPLPNVTSKRVTEMRDALKDLLYSNGLRLRGDRAAQRWTEEDESNNCKYILGELWNGVVKPVLDSLAFYVSFISFFCIRPTDNLCPGSSGCTSTHLVVSNWATRLPPNPRRWNIQPRLYRFTCQ
jgi:tetratricopeptide (TPR) repeat protein